MASFVRRSRVVKAEQWYPDPERGRFSDGKYRNKSIGYDRHGVEYTVTEVGLHTKQGFMRVKPGDWIVTGEDGRKWAVEMNDFPLLYGPLGRE